MRGGPGALCRLVSSILYLDRARPATVEGDRSARDGDECEWRCALFDEERLRGDVALDLMSEYARA